MPTGMVSFCVAASSRLALAIPINFNSIFFEVPEAMTDFASSGSFGMMGLQERAQLFGGNVTVQSQPQVGTVVHMVMSRRSDPAQFELPTTSSVPDTEVSQTQLAVDKV